MALAVVIPLGNELDRDVQAVGEPGSGVHCAEAPFPENVLAAVRVMLHQLSLRDHCTNTDLFN